MKNKPAVFTALLVTPILFFVLASNVLAVVGPGGVELPTPVESGGVSHSREGGIKPRECIPIPNSDIISNTNICIPTDLTTMVGWIYAPAIGFGTGLAIITIIFSGFMMMTSRGDPGKIANGKKYIQNALIGLVFIILAGTILRIIAGGLIGIPIIG